MAGASDVVTDERRDHRRALLLVAGVLGFTLVVGWPVLRIIGSGGVVDGIELSRVALPGLDVSLPTWAGEPVPREWSQGSHRVARGEAYASVSWSVSDRPVAGAVRAELRERAGRAPARTWKFELEGQDGEGAVVKRGGGSVAVVSFRCPSDPRLFALTIAIPASSLRDLRELSARVLATAVCVEDARQPG